MTPEMMFRKPGEHPGESVDIWSLGAMMFQILTGKVPFGVYLQAAVNVQDRNREPWPDFMTSNPQYTTLAKQLQSLVEECLPYEVADRPSADEIVGKISDLCFIGVDRKIGKVSNLIKNGYSGFSGGDDGSTTFFSQESVYSPKPQLLREQKCATQVFPGHHVTEAIPSS